MEFVNYQQMIHSTIIMIQRALAPTDWQQSDAKQSKRDFIDDLNA